MSKYDSGGYHEGSGNKFTKLLGGTALVVVGSMIFNFGEERTRGLDYLSAQRSEEAKFEASGKLSVSERVDNSIPGNVLREAGEFIQRLFGEGGAVAGAFVDKVGTFKYEEQSLDQRQAELALSLHLPWLQEGESATTAMQLAEDLFEKYPELKTQTFTLYDHRKEADVYRRNVDMLSNAPGQYLDPRKQNFSTQMFSIQTTDSNWHDSHKYFLVHMRRVGKNKDLRVEHLVVKCHTNNCVGGQNSDVRTPDEVASLFESRGSTIFDRQHPVGVREVTEQRRAEVMRQAEKAENYQQQYQVNRLENPNGTFRRDNNQASENYPKQRVVVAPLSESAVQTNSVSPSSNVWRQGQVVPQGYRRQWDGGQWIIVPER